MHEGLKQKREKGQLNASQLKESKQTNLQPGSKSQASRWYLLSRETAIAAIRYPRDVTTYWN